MLRPASTFLVVLAFAPVLGACGDDDDGVTDVDAAAFDAATPDAGSPDAALPDAAPPDAAAPTGVTVSCEGAAPGDDHHQYVMSAIEIPVSASTAQMLGLDLDGDPQGRPDNALGQILSVFASQADLDIQSVMDAAITAGDVRQLVDVTATDLSADGAATAQSFLGGDCDDPPNPADDFSGTESLGPLPDALTDAVLTGTVDSGTLRVFGVGPIEVKVPFLGSFLVRLPLHGAMIEASVAGGEITGGKIGGAVTEADIDAVFIPALADGIQSVVEADCPGTAPDCCTKGTTGETMTDLFDADLDCVITAEELRTNDLISSLLAPDVDLFDAEGAYNPRVDGVKDGLSLGLGFTAVPAILPIAESE